MKAIESERLLVREWIDDDKTDLYELKRSQHSFLDYLRVGTVDDALEYINIWKEYREMYPVILKESGKVIGVVGLVDINKYRGYKELEVHICDTYNDADYVTEAHRLILDYGFSELGLSVAFSYCCCGESVLKQALIDTGFVYEGTLRRFGRDMSNKMRYSLIKEEYRS